MDCILRNASVYRSGGFERLDLLIRGGIGVPVCILIALLTAIVCTVTELCTKNGYDTVVCPLSAMAVILPMIALIGG